MRLKFVTVHLLRRLKLASGEAIRKHDEMIIIRYMIRNHPLPELQKKSNVPDTKKVMVGDKEYDVPTSFNFQKTFCGDLTTQNEQEVSHYLKLVIDAGCSNESHEVIETMGQIKTPNRFRDNRKVS